MATRCAQCNAEVENRDPREPCPHCGSLVRDLERHGTENISIEVSATATVIRHWARLLETAERLHANGEHSVAVIVAQTASEVIVERAITNALASKNVPELFPFVNSFSLTRDWTKRLYNTLTGDDIQTKEQRIWNAFLELVSRRNKSVHSGADVAAADARAGIDAAKALVAHVEQHNGLQ